jgi:predicted RNA-binding protein with PIN domain
MALLIDGHNLISALPDIDLDDPHDEAKLVEKLKGYCGRTGKSCTVVFDQGIPGGQSRDLSAGPVRVIFAAAYRTSADRVIRERIREARDPGALTVVSSDHEVRAAALQRNMRVLTSEAFADLMHEAMTPEGDDETDDVHLSEAEVNDWLRFFGEGPGEES